MANDTMPSQKEETAAPPAVKKPRVSAPAAPTASTPSVHTAAGVAAMSARQYMDELIVPTLLRALASVNKERPVDPIDYLSIYLAKEKEQKPMDLEQQEVKGSTRGKD